MKALADKPKSGVPESRRLQARRRVDVRFPTFREPVPHYISDVSQTGMFVEMESPQPPGSRFQFEMELEEPGGARIRGHAEVVWVRLAKDGPVSQTAGVGARFLQLGEDGRDQLVRLIEREVRRGGRVAEVQDMRLVVDQMLAEQDRKRFDVATPFRRLTAKKEPPPPSPSPRHDPWRPPAAPGSAAPGSGWPRRVAAGLAVVLGLAAAVYWFSRPLIVPQPLDPPDVAVAGIGGAAPVTSSEVPAGAPPAVSLAAPESVLEVVRAWARAWSEQRVEDYLSYYGRGFEPPAGLSRSAWMAQRRERLAAPGFIRVAVSAFETESLEGDRVAARFLQSYRSDRLDDLVRKTLILGEEDGEWRILEELAQ